VDAQSYLFQIVRAGSAAGRFSGCLHRGQEQGHNDTNNRDDNEQFDESKGMAWGSHGGAA
jgi:hypothetical protein